MADINVTTGSISGDLNAPPMSRVLLVSSAAAMGGFLFGFDTAVINGAVAAIQKWSGAGDTLLGFSVASLLLSAAVGAWFAGPLANRYGRLAVMKTAAVIFIVSAIGSGFALGIWAFFGFPLFGGR